MNSKTGRRPRPRRSELSPTGRCHEALDVNSNLVRQFQADCAKQIDEIVRANRREFAKLSNDRVRQLRTAAWYWLISQDVHPFDFVKAVKATGKKQLIQQNNDAL